MSNLRPSPSSSATLYKVGVIKKGNDGNKWIIVQNKNGIKRWNKYKILFKKESKKNSKKESKKNSKKESKKNSKKESKKNSKNNENFLTLKNFFNIKKVLSLKDLEKIIIKNDASLYIYNIIKNKIIPEINKLDIKIFIVPLPLSDDDIYWTDYASSYIKEKYNIDLLKINYLYFTFYINNEGNNINFDREIKINYYLLNKEIKKKIINIFEKYLFQYYYWNGSNNKQMVIFYNKNKKIHNIDQTKLKDDDYFPVLEIYLATKINLFNNPKIFNEIDQYFIKIFKNYELSSDCYKLGCTYTVTSFNDLKIIDKIKKFVESKPYFFKAKLYSINNKNDEEKNIWNYKKKIN